jgi:hypothetical protein
MNESKDEKVALLRHALATLAYRGGKAMKDAPAGFSGFAASPGSRTPGQIQAHLGDLLDWALSIARGEQVWRDTAPLVWEQGVTRFFAGLAALDAFLASGAPLECPPEKLFQGPVADALTHVGQIAMLRRMAGAPVRGENYFKAGIAVGRVGADQPPPNREFE